MSTIYTLYDATIPPVFIEDAGVRRLVEFITKHGKSQSDSNGFHFQVQDSDERGDAYRVGSVEEDDYGIHGESHMSNSEPLLARLIHQGKISLLELGQHGSGGYNSGCFEYETPEEDHANARHAAEYAAELEVQLSG